MSNFSFNNDAIIFILENQASDYLRDRTITAIPAFFAIPALTV